MSASFLQLSFQASEVTGSDRVSVLSPGHKLQTGKRIVVDDAMDPEAVGRYALQVKVQG